MISRIVATIKRSGTDGIGSAGDCLHLCNMEEKMTDAEKLAKEYDQEAEDTGWLAPEIAFGLAYKYVSPGESILDLGIGTGLGSVLFHKAGLHIYGMDISNEMLDACRSKGFADCLKQHDLTVYPYPFADMSIDHAICVGVLPFFNDLDRAFGEVSRILHRGGIFVFMTCHRDAAENSEIAVSAGPRDPNTKVTVYRHSAEQVKSWLVENDFQLTQFIDFPMYLDNEKNSSLPCRIYLAGKVR